MICIARTIWPALGAVALGLILSGCGGSTAENTAGSGSTNASAQATTPAATSAVTAASSQSESAPAELAAFFPGASLQKKAFPMDAALASHMSEEGKVKFSGKEAAWEVFEASQNGARQGYAVMTHSDLPGGGDMHIAFAVGKSFKITGAKAVEAPDVAKMNQLVAQLKGRSHSNAFKIGQDVKAVAGVPAATAQIAADAVHKGLLILEENFDPSHAEDEAAHAAGGHAH